MLLRQLVKLAMRSPCATPLPNFNGGRLVRVRMPRKFMPNYCLLSSSFPFSPRVEATWKSIHFNTTNLGDDLKSMAENPRLRDSYAPLPIEEGDYGPVLADFLDIFPFNTLRVLRRIWGILSEPPDPRFPLRT